MSRQNNYQSGQFADSSGDYPHQYPQHHSHYSQQVSNSPTSTSSHPNQLVVNFNQNQQQDQNHQHPHQYGMQNHQQHIHQPPYQVTKPQQYTYQPSHQNFQQHPPQQRYSELGKRQHFAVNQSRQQFVAPPPLPPSVLPPPPAIQPLLQQQLIPKPTDPRNARPNPVPFENSNIPSNESSSSSTSVSTQPQPADISKRKKRQLKRQFRKEKKMTYINKAVDSGLAEFLQEFSMDEYRKYIHKLRITIPVTDRCHTKNMKHNQKDKAKICISYQCSGICQTPCKKTESHRALSQSERKRFFDYLSEVKSRILEERSNQKQKSLSKKKARSKKGAPEGSANEDDIFDKNPTKELVLKEIVDASNLLEYHKRAKKFDIPIPQLDALDGSGSRKGRQICPVYHCEGKCPAHCPNKESHRQLTAAEHRRLSDYLLELQNIVIEERVENSNEGEELDEEQELDQGGEESRKNGKRKADAPPDDSSGLDASKKKQRLDLDNNDGRFDDCSDDDEVQILEIIGPTVGTPVVTARCNDDGTAANPVDLADSLTPMTKELYTGLPGTSSHVNPKTADSIVVSLSSSLELDQTSDTTTASVPTTEDTTTTSVPTASSDGDIVGDSHQALSLDNSSTAAQARSVGASRNDDQPGEIPKLSGSSTDEASVNRADKEATMKPAGTMPVDQTKPSDQPRKEALSPNSKSRKLKKLKAQLELAKKQHELAKLKESLRKKDQELKEQRSQDSFRPNMLPPISALTTSLIIDNIHESGPEHMVCFPNSQVDNDLRLTEYKAILFGKQEEEEAKETLSARKTQIERDLVVLKQRLESSLPTTAAAAAASMSKEDLQRKLEEAQANKDLSYWKLFVSKQEHILSGVDKQIQENETSLEQCRDEMANVERESRETLNSIKVLKVREATLAEMAAKSSTKILELRQRLHEEQAQVEG